MNFTELNFFQILRTKMSNISYAAYLSELYNLRNMIKNQAIDTQQINVKLIELEHKTPESLVPIDVWEEGEGVHNRSYSADVVYQKLSKVIERIEQLEGNTTMRLDEIIEKIDTLHQLETQQTEILGAHGRQINMIAATSEETRQLVENSVLPTLLSIEEKVDKLGTLSEKVILSATEVKGILTDSIVPSITKLDERTDVISSNVSKLSTSNDRIESLIKEILTYIKKV